MPWSQREALSLYRSLLRAGRLLRYTDRDLFLRTVRTEFRKHKDEVQPEKRELLLEKGRRFLRNGLGGLV